MGSTSCSLPTIAPRRRSRAWFDANEWRRAGAVAIETSGRGEVLIVAHGDESWVLRHYRRGGLVARFIDDHYIWLGMRARTSVSRMAAAARAPRGGAARAESGCRARL